MNLQVLKVGIRFEHDIVLARQKARTLAGLLGFDSNDQTRISTAVSEIARNAFKYAGGGEMEFLVEGLVRPQVFMARVMDRGHGIADVSAILCGQYVSHTGMGLGITGARRLMDHFHIETVRGQGTTVILGKIIPKDAPLITVQSLSRIVGILEKQAPRDPFEEIQQQNRELMHALAEIKQRKEEQELLNKELEDTNRGIVALYAELDEKATNLTRANELKVRFLSNMSHEFRTPLSSILSLAQILVARLDGELTDEQARQVNFIKKAAEELLVLVNDLLDLAKIEAGKVVVHSSECLVPNIFSALRGMIKPILANSSISLVIEEPEGIPAMITDEGKVSQILRNLISNSIKFTEKGEIRVSAEPGGDGKTVRFIVADTGIGIPREYLEKIFEEYTQVDTRLHITHKGTGLGLPLSRKLAELLGGTLTVESTAGSGSVFTATIPVVHQDGRCPQDGNVVEPVECEAGSIASGVAAFIAKPADKKCLLSQLESVKPSLSSDTVLLIDNDEVARYLLKGFLAETGYSILEADSGTRGIEMARDRLPGIIFLDLEMPEMNGFETLEKLKADPATCDIPVVIVSSKVLGTEERATLGGKTYAVLPKTHVSREAAIDSIGAAILGITARTSQET